MNGIVAVSKIKAPRDAPLKPMNIEATVPETMTRVMLGK
jgi:hypothetical protein